MLVMHLFTALGIFLLPAQVTPADTPRTLATVTVQGSPSQVAGTYQSLIRGTQTFEDKRGALGQNSTLHFQVSKSTSELYADVDGTLVPIPLNDRRQFELPLAGIPSGPWKLVSFGKATEILPVVESPETTETNKRVGDLRLQCQVLWSMVQPDIALGKRLALKMSGGLCASSLVEISFPTDRKILSAKLTYRTESYPIKIQWDGLGFSVPLKDANVPNDAFTALVLDSPVSSEASSNYATLTVMASVATDDLAFGVNGVDAPNTLDPPRVRLFVAKGQRTIWYRCPGFVYTDWGPNLTFKFQGGVSYDLVCSASGSQDSAIRLSSNGA